MFKRQELKFQFETIDLKEEKDIKSVAEHNKLWFESTDKLILALYLDEKTEKPKEYANRPNLEPIFLTSEEEFLGAAYKDKSSEMTKLN